MLNKKGLIWGELIKWIIAAVIIVVMVLVTMALSGNMDGAIAFVEEIFTFRRV